LLKTVELEIEGLVFSFQEIELVSILFGEEGLVVSRLRDERGGKRGQREEGKEAGDLHSRCGIGRLRIARGGIGGWLVE
jgi:hypothetical protein